MAVQIVTVVEIIQREVRDEIKREQCQLYDGRGTQQAHLIASR